MCLCSWHAVTWVLDPEMNLVLHYCVVCFAARTRTTGALLATSATARGTSRGSTPCRTSASAGHPVRRTSAAKTPDSVRETTSVSSSVQRHRVCVFASLAGSASFLGRHVKSTTIVETNEKRQLCLRLFLLSAHLTWLETRHVACVRSRRFPEFHLQACVKTNEACGRPSRHRRSYRLKPNCLHTFSVNWGNARFIWAPSLDYDNRILFRYTKCDFGTYPVVQGQSPETPGLPAKWAW